MNELSIIIDKFYKETNIINQIRNFLFYNNFNFFKFYINFYIYFDNKIKILNFFNIKFIFNNIKLQIYIL
jgi:hypothetical protein